MIIKINTILQAPQIGGSGYQFPTVAVAPPPNFDGPHDFLVLALVTTIFCAILNLVSLAFGIPAIILSAMVGLFIIYVIMYTHMPLQ